MRTSDKVIIIVSFMLLSIGTYGDTVVYKGTYSFLGCLLRNIYEVILVDCGYYIGSRFGGKEKCQ